MTHKMPNPGWPASIKKFPKRIFNIVELPYTQVMMALFGLALTVENQSPAYFLAEAMYYETWEEPYFTRGRQAIAAVLLNRTKDPRWSRHVEFVVKETKNGTCSLAYRCDAYPNNPWFDGVDRWPRWLIIKYEANWYFFAHHYLGLTLDPTDGALFFKRRDQQSDWFSNRVADYRLTQVPGDFGSLEFFWE